MYQVVARNLKKKMPRAPVHEARGQARDYTLKYTYIYKTKVSRRHEKGSGEAFFPYFFNNNNNNNKKQIDTEAGGGGGARGLHRIQNTFITRGKIQSIDRDSR